MRARSAADLAREQVAALIGARPHDIIWTSGATESNNRAILGIARAASEPGHLITCATEHKAVLDPMHQLERQGWTCTVLPPAPDGRVSADQLREALRDDTKLVSLMTANNETGVLHPIAELAAVCRDAGVLFHTDAAQATGRVPLDVGALGVDLMSLTAHKTYGPKGIGALYIRPGRPRIRLQPLQFGGAQERGYRSGTLPVPLVVGFGKAAALAAEDLVNGEVERLAGLRQKLWDGLQSLGGVQRHGSWIHRLPHNLNIAFDGVQAAALMMALRPIACSSGSACSSENPKPSHVLTALGIPRAQALGAVRFGIGRPNTEADIDTLLEALRTEVPKLRSAVSGHTS
jgi:cysteine desulfurase